jgi:hypothetical protein
MPSLASLVMNRPTGMASAIRPASPHQPAAQTTKIAGFGRLASTPARRATAAPVIDVVLCRDRTMLESAQRLRYQVYCIELGRQSPHADHDRMIIGDPLDRFGHTFIAIEDGETIGTLRTNFCKEGSLGIYEEHYGMRASKHHPDQTAICTKFIVKRSKRGSLAFFKLMFDGLQYLTRRGAAECYIDCIPSLVPFYERCEFRVAGEVFCHNENGPSIPLMLDLARHGNSLCERLGPRHRGVSS